MKLYFNLATYYNIIDRPNERSSHAQVTIRGGGMIYVITAIVAVLWHPNYWIFLLGLLIIGIISFIDDKITLSGKIRLIFHLIAVTLMFFSLDVLSVSPLWTLPLIYIFVIGIINAYNFMDGINGITGSYSLVILIGLQYINYQEVHFVESDLIWLPILASLIFLFFNFRKKAKCFAGDVGSISSAFWIVSLILMIIIRTGDYKYILFLSVYGVDTVLTIVHRLFLKQNIFEAHRLHFYQILANDLKIPHLIVSIIYSSLQFLIILIVIFIKVNVVALFGLILFPLILAYIILKPILMDKPGSVSFYK